MNNNIDWIIHLVANGACDECGKEEKGFLPYKYSDFDLDQPFLTQYEKNLQQLKASLSLLAEQP